MQEITTIEFNDNTLSREIELYQKLLQWMCINEVAVRKTILFSEENLLEVELKSLDDFRRLFAGTTVTQTTSCASNYLRTSYSMTRDSLRFVYACPLAHRRQDDVVLGSA